MSTAVRKMWTFHMSSASAASLYLDTLLVLFLVFDNSTSLLAQVSINDMILQLIFITKVRATCMIALFC